MIKFLLTAAPYLLKMPAARSQKQVARSFTALALFALGGLALTAAAFIFVTSVYGAAVGFVTISGMFFTAGLVLFLKSKRAVVLKNEITIAGTSSDPIAAMVPDGVLKDPAVSKVLAQISKNPLAASAAAATIGMLITREFMGD